MSEILTDGADHLGALTFGTRSFPRSPQIGTAIATLVAFPPFNYRGMQAVSAPHPPPGGPPPISGHTNATREVHTVAGPYACVKRSRGFRQAPPARQPHDIGAPSALQRSDAHASGRNRPRAIGGWMRMESSRRIDQRKSYIGRMVASRALILLPWREKDTKPWRVASRRSWMRGWRKAGILS
jgi:hypothetical protein